MVEVRIDVDIDQAVTLSGTAVPWEVVLAELPVAAGALDLQGRPVRLTPALRRLVSPSALQAAVLTAQVPPSLAATDPERRLLDLDAPGDDRVARVRSRTGVELVVLVRTGPVQDGTPYLLVHVTPAPAPARDSLTGLVLRDVLLGRLGQALARQSRSGGELELVVFDLDGFKSVNDRHGHGVGDEVLVEVARRVRELSRPQDTVCRWGGDEFVLLLEAPEVEGGAAVSLRIADALIEPVATAAGPVPVGTSVGWVRSRLGESPESVLHRADMVMYEHKRVRRARPPLAGRLAQATSRSLALRDETDAALAGARGSIEVLRGTLCRYELRGS